MAEADSLRIQLHAHVTSATSAPTPAPTIGGGLRNKHYDETLSLDENSQTSASRGGQMVVS